MSKLNKEELYKYWFSNQEYNNQDRLQELIDMGVDVNYKDSANLTALFYSISHNKINNVEFLLKIVKYLIQNKVDVNVQDNEGNTALMKAVQKGRIMLVSFLLFCGVDLSLKNNYGFTVMQIPTTKLIKDYLNSWMKEDVI